MARNVGLLLSACLALATAVSSPALAGEKGWVEKRCAAYRGDYCRIPFTVAMAQPENLAAVQRVQLRGFLVRESNGYVLYESKEAAFRGWRCDALLISEPTVEATQKSLERWNGSLVRIRGRIALEAIDYDEYWAKFDLDSPVLIATIRGEMQNP